MTDSTLVTVVTGIMALIIVMVMGAVIANSRCRSRHGCEFGCRCDLERKHFGEHVGPPVGVGTPNFRWHHWPRS